MADARQPEQLRSRAIMEKDDGDTTCITLMEICCAGLEKTLTSWEMTTKGFEG